MGYDEARKKTCMRLKKFINSRLLWCFKIHIFQPGYFRCEWEIFDFTYGNHCITFQCLQQALSFIISTKSYIIFCWWTKIQTNTIGWHNAPVKVRDKKNEEKKKEKNEREKMQFIQVKHHAILLSNSTEWIKFTFVSERSLQYAKCTAIKLIHRLSE